MFNSSKNSNYKGKSLDSAKLNKCSRLATASYIRALQTSRGLTADKCLLRIFIYESNKDVEYKWLSSRIQTIAKLDGTEQFKLEQTIIFWYKVILAGKAPLEVLSYIACNLEHDLNED